MFQLLLMTGLWYLLLPGLLGMALVPVTETFVGRPPQTCIYQDYTYRILQTDLCLRYGVCYCQVVPRDVIPGGDDVISSTTSTPSLPGTGPQFNDIFDLTTSTPFRNEIPTADEGELFYEWKPQPPSCACWCSGLQYEVISSDIIYQSTDTCVLDEQNCFCDEDPDTLWRIANNAQYSL